MEIKLSQELVTILAYAREEAMRTGSYGITADHLLLGIIRHGENGACALFRESGIDTGALKAHIDSLIFHDKCVPFGESDKISVSRSAQNAINLAGFEALRDKDDEIRAAHLLIAITRSGNSVGRDYMAGMNVGSDELLKCHAAHKKEKPAVETATAEATSGKSPKKQLLFFTRPSKDQIPS